MKKAISIILAVILGAAGYIGVRYAIRQSAGQTTDYAPIRKAPAPRASDIPTDEYGNNLYGNHASNLYGGGFVAMQGGGAVFANFAAGGSLFSEDANGKTTKLTEFPVANLNFVGDRLVFTDLQFCVFIDENGQSVAMSANSHNEVWEAAGEDEHINYGGRLYFLNGAARFMAGEIEYEDMELFVVNDDKPYLSPAVADGWRLVVLTVTDEGYFAGGGAIALPSTISHIPGQPMPGDEPGAQPALRTASGEYKIVTLSQPYTIAGASFSVMTMPYDVGTNIGANTVMITDFSGRTTSVRGAPGELIRGAWTIENTVYVETYVNSSYDPASDQMKSRVHLIDSASGNNLGYYIGGNLQTAQNRAYFQHGDKIYALEKPGGSGANDIVARQVNAASADPGFRVRPDGSVEYTSNYDAGPGSKTGKVNIYTILGTGAIGPGMEISSRTGPVRRSISAVFGGSEIYWQWDDANKTSGGFFRRTRQDEDIDGNRVKPYWDTEGLSDWNGLHSETDMRYGVPPQLGPKFEWDIGQQLLPLTNQIAGVHEDTGVVSEGGGRGAEVPADITPDPAMITPAQPLEKSAEQHLIGKWRADYDDLIMEFYTDCTLTIYSSAGYNGDEGSLIGKYSVDGDSITIMLYIGGANASSEMTTDIFIFSVGESTLTMNVYGGGEALTYKRIH